MDMDHGPCNTKYPEPIWIMRLEKHRSELEVSYESSDEVNQDPILCTNYVSWFCFLFFCFDTNKGLPFTAEKVTVQTSPAGVCFSVFTTAVLNSTVYTLALIIFEMEGAHIKYSRHLVHFNSLWP